MNLFNKSKIKESKAVENFNMILLDVIDSPEIYGDIKDILVKYQVMLVKTRNIERVKYQLSKELRIYALNRTLSGKSLDLYNKVLMANDSLESALINYIKII